MATTVMDMVQRTKLSAVIIALFYTNTALAGDWQFSPSIVIDETYSDNIELVANNKKSGLVSQTGLHLDSSYNAQHAVFNFASQSTYALYSHNHDIDNDYHALASNFRLQLWPNGIILVGSADIANRSQNSSRNAIADIVSADTVRVETYNGGIEYNNNNSAFIINSAIGYRVTNSEDSIGDREGVVAQITSQNGTGARNIFWQLKHSYQELKNDEREGKLSQSEVKLGLITDYKINPFLRYYDEDNSGDIRQPNRSLESNSVGLGVRWLVTPRLYIDSSYNKPIGDKLDVDGDEQKAYINAALKWQPSIRTRLEASFSERFYGNSYGLDFTHRNRRLTNTVSYVEYIQTLTRNNFIPSTLGFYFCPSDSITLIDECTLENGNIIFPDNPNNPDDQGYFIFPVQEFTLVEDNVFSLNKTFTWNSTLALPRTTVNFNANRQRRDNLETRIEDERSVASINLKRKISGRSSVDLDLSYTETNLQINTESERMDRYRRYQLRFEKSLNSALSFNVAVSYLNRSSDSAVLNYEEGRVTAKVTKGF
ncbi:MAG: TIGR03016 family PEP-CTERM system-associated outer membrane protein [Cognaticolwellia sp.]